MAGIILSGIAAARAGFPIAAASCSMFPIVTYAAILARRHKLMTLLRFGRPSLQRSDGRRRREKKVAAEDQSTEIESRMFQGSLPLQMTAQLCPN
jgi:hypothetical protein